MSVPDEIIGVAQARLQLITADNGYSADVSQVILPRRQTDWQPLDRTITLIAGEMDRDDELFRPGNPPAVAWVLPIEVRCIVIPSNANPHSFDQIAFDFAAEAQKAIADAPAWWQFVDRAINAEIGPIKPYRPDDESPGGANFTVSVTYRASELDPNEIRG